mgnify:CR=1 FL=1|jgi:multidrug transporter EmrE-like cation transporter
MESKTSDRKSTDKKISWKDIVLLQIIVMIFSLTSVTAKFASMQDTFTSSFFLFYGAELAILAVYALLWQQAIKKFDISVAYANKAMVLLWGLLWGTVIFHDAVNAKEIAGVALVIVGVIVINRGDNTGMELTDE